MRSYTLVKAAEFLGCSRRKVQMLVNGDKATGAKPALAYFHVGRAKRITHQDLIAYRDSMLNDDSILNGETVVA